ncbi:MAG TPA: hypothetical protein VGD10_12445 [Allosphingosinicella sp.]|uniref:hypothetical protein n=1 Tax=Allosphingosinicella sp. TaxID=2823234 RepID=UPI002EDA2265
MFWGPLIENRLLEPSRIPATPLVERLRSGAGRRALGVGLALLIEGLLLLVLLTLGVAEPPQDSSQRITVVNVNADNASEDTPAPASAEREQQSAERPVPQESAPEEPVPPQPIVPKTPPPLPAIMPAPLPLPVPTQPATPSMRPVQPAPAKRAAYGPPDRGGSSASRDTERVGTAPNGEPLYAAAWYREPREDELSGYMSTASGPGWGLIACRTAPNYRVEDCVALSEYPYGAQINRAVLAAAWQFKVRPPQKGGKSLVGSWVRIRIDYGIKRR